MPDTETKQYTPDEVLAIFSERYPHRQWRVLAGGASGYAEDGTAYRVGYRNHDGIWVASYFNNDSSTQNPTAPFSTDINVVFSFFDKLKSQGI